MKKLAIITTHPIQYYAPIFKMLHERKNINIKVFYTWGQSATQKHDPGFNKPVNWDIPLLDGYPYEWVINTAKKPGSHRFSGIITPLLSDQVLAWRPDAVLFFGWAYVGHLKAIKKLSNVLPLYFRGDSTLLNEPKGIKRTLKLFFLKWLYRHFTHAFYVGANNKAYFKKYGLTDAQLSFTPHAIDNDRFNSLRVDEASVLRSSLNIKPDDILVLYAGKLDVVKNLPLLLKAFSCLKKANVHLLLVGNGIQEGLLKQMAAASGLPGNVHFFGFANQSYMPVFYQAADLVCLPSVSETWGLAVNEAMACGKAVLVSDKVGCAVDLVKPGYNGSIFKSGNEDDLLLHLAQLTQSKVLLEEYGRNSGKIIKDWNFTKIAKAIETKLIL
jgi:glycosyltransferase involved in cell wall biosynthesis